MLCNAAVLPLDGGRSIEIEVHLTPALLKNTAYKKGERNHTKFALNHVVKSGTAASTFIV